MLNTIILILGAISLMILFFSLTRKDIFDPLFLTPAYWILFFYGSILVSVIFKLIWKWEGLIPIFFLLFEFVAGSMAMKVLSHRPVFQFKDDSQKGRRVPSSLGLKWVIVAYSCLGLIALGVQMNFLHIPFSQLANLSGLVNYISTIRYAGGIDMPIFGQVLLAFLYSAGFLSGVLSGQENTEKIGFYPLIPFVVSLLFVVTNGVKAGFLFLTIIFLSGYAATFVYRNKRNSDGRWKLSLKILFILLVLLSVIPLTDKIKNEGGKGNPVLNCNSVSYLGSLNAFTLWYSSAQSHEVHGFKYTFSGIHNLIYKNRQSGLYGTDNVVVGWIQEKPIFTNVYTIVRGLIEDFTLGGAMFVLFMTGFATQIFYHLTKKGHVRSHFFLALFYSVLLNGFTVCILTYNTIILSWGISFFTLLLVFSMEERKGA